MYELHDAPDNASLMCWPMLYPKFAERWFRIRDFLALHARVLALELRPATLAAARAEGLDPIPFTASQCACPTEGSAT